MPLNSIINALNAVIQGVVMGVNIAIRAINKLSFTVPDWVPGLGGAGINIPYIPLLAKGGDIVRSGSAIVGEAGPELIDLPVGAKVTPLNNSGGSDVAALLNVLIDEIRKLNQGMPEAVRAGVEGVEIDWDDRNLGRLVNKYA